MVVNSYIVNGFTSTILMLRDVWCSYYL